MGKQALFEKVRNHSADIKEQIERDTKVVEVSDVVLVTCDSSATQDDLLKGLGIDINRPYAWYRSEVDFKTIIEQGPEYAQ